MKKQHVLYGFAIFLATLVLTWILGLSGYVSSIENTQAEPVGSSETDAIVVLTGGSERVKEGLNLFREKKGKKLFISGVYPGLTLDHIVGSGAVPKEESACCIKLDYTAETTFGNAWETRAWMESEQFHSMRLVTASYHMPRSLMIFHAIMPGITIIPHTVTPDTVKLNGWWHRGGTASLLITEYNKFLLAKFRLWIGSA